MAVHMLALYETGQSVEVGDVAQLPACGPVVRVRRHCGGAWFSVESLATGQRAMVPAQRLTLLERAR